MAYGTVEEQSRDNDVQTTPDDQPTQQPDSHRTSNDEENPLLGADETGQKIANIASVIAVLLLGAIMP